MFFTIVTFTLVEIRIRLSAEKSDFKMRYLNEKNSIFTDATEDYLNQFYGNSSGLRKDVLEQVVKRYKCSNPKVVHLFQLMVNEDPSVYVGRSL